MNFATELATRFTVQLFEGYRPYMTQAPIEQILPMYISEGGELVRITVGICPLLWGSRLSRRPAVRSTVVRPIATVLRNMVEDMLRSAVEKGEVKADLDVDAVVRVLHTLTIAIGDGLIFPQLMNYYQLTDGGISPQRIYAAFTDLVMHGIIKERGS